MLLPVYHKNSFSITDLGGDHGMDAGIDLPTTIVVGLFIQEFPYGITGYRTVGERITEPIVGEAIHGTIIIYNIMISKETGGLGIAPTIGINQNTVR